ncbi:MAG: response regulator [FCB group bacterium]|nr:response regulator [FCB group bacterium]
MRVEKKPKALIVEDEFISGLLWVTIFEQKGYEICGQVGKGEEAVRIAVSEKPEVILMDIGLAGPMDGIEAANEICKSYRPKLIFMTGYSDKETMQKAKALRAAAYLTKPISTEQLEAVIDEIKK